MSSYGLDAKVLLRIAEGVNSFYGLTKKERVGSNEGVLSALERLEEKKFIQKGDIGPRNVQPYYVTKDGFDVVLRIIDGIKNFDSFVENNKEHFPILFNYWESLGKHDLHSWIIHILTNSVREIDTQIQREIILGERQRYSHKEFIDDISSMIYGPWIITERWEDAKQNIPFDKIMSFLNVNKEIIESRKEIYRIQKLNQQLVLDNLEQYKKEILSN